MKRARTAIVATALLVGACSGAQNDSNLNIGAIAGVVVGGVAGGYAGNWVGGELGGSTVETLFTVLGVAGGAAVGYEAGRQIMVADVPDYNRAVVNAVDGSYGEATWDNPTTGNGGLIRADQAFLNGNGEECRTYRATVAFTDEIVNGPGTVCRGNQGEWVLVADAFQ